MEMQSASLPSGKQVFLWEPFDNNKVQLAPLVGRQMELESVIAAWITRAGRAPLNPILVGDPGVGKNRIVFELAKLTRLPLYILQGHDDISSEDVACTLRIGADASKSIEYILSPLMTAMLNGGICLVDEIGKIRPRALALLASVLDERRYIDSTVLAERVYARPEFRFIATTNTGEEGELPEFIRSRLMPVIRVGHPEDAEINSIISQLPGAVGGNEKLLKTFWEQWKIRSPNLRTARDVIQVFSYAASLASYRHARLSLSKAKSGKIHDSLSGRNGSGEVDIEPADLVTAFEKLYPLPAR